jgi:Ser-Thr-rich glycosyl-phosphatidyl-inositol-anchored membrane family
LITCPAVPNTGTTTFTIPQDIVSGTDYTVQIADANNGPNVNYSPYFAITGGTGVSSAAATAAATTAGATTAAASSGAATTAAAASSTGTTKTTKTKATSLKTTAATESAATTTAAPSGAANNVRSGPLAAVVGLGALVMLA